jgi:serine/threonine protein kinase
VVKNLIIQNSNLQNCNVYIGGNGDEKEVTIVQKDEDPRETGGHFSAQQQSELSPLLPESRTKDKNSKEKQTLADFKITRLIGEGHQGKVVQATHRATGKVFALKIIPQKLIKEQKQIQHIFNEKWML